LGDVIGGSSIQKKLRREKVMKKDCTGVNSGLCFMKVPFPIVNDDRPDPT